MLFSPSASRESTTAVFFLWWDSKSTKASQWILVLMNLYVISFQTNETPYNNYRHVTMWGDKPNKSKHLKCELA